MKMEENELKRETLKKFKTIVQNMDLDAYIQTDEFKQIFSMCLANRLLDVAGK